MELEVCRPDRGLFLSVDGEGQTAVRFIVDSSQVEVVKRLLDLPYGDTFLLSIQFTNRNKTHGKT